MSNVLAIAFNTFREAIRNKVLYSLLFFAIVVIVGALAFGALSVHEEVRLTTDLGLAGMSLFSVIIAIFIGVNLLYKELERKTIYTLIPKPIHRYQFVAGKFMGMVLTLGVLLAVMSAVLLVTIIIQGGAAGAVLLKMVLLIFLEVVIVTAVAVFFSSFSTPLLSGLLTVGVFLVGRSVPDIRAVAAKADNPALRLLLDGVARVVPNLRHFYATGAEANGDYISVHADFVPWSYVGLSAVYAAICAAVVLILAMVLFSRRDFI